HRKSEQGRDDHHDRGEKMHRLVGAQRNHVLFNEHLDSVGYRLEQTEGPDAVWAVAILNSAKDLALEHGKKGKERRENNQQRRDRDQRRRDLHEPFRRAGQKRKDTPLRANKNLVESLTRHLRRRKRERD